VASVIPLIQKSLNWDKVLLKRGIIAIASECISQMVLTSFPTIHLSMEVSLGHKKDGERTSYIFISKMTAKVEIVVNYTSDSAL
jgi:hypothetical protein